MAGPCCRVGHEQVAAQLAAVRGVMHEQWAAMDGNERAFLLYCLLRLGQHLDASISWQNTGGASGRDTTGTAATVADVLASMHEDSG
jgi:hypothetical protein